jgi:hypothetical protein
MYALCIHDRGIRVSLTSAFLGHNYFFNKNVLKNAYLATKKTDIQLKNVYIMHTKNENVCNMYANKCMQYAGIRKMYALCKHLKECMQYVCKECMQYAYNRKNAYNMHTKIKMYAICMQYVCK